MQMPAPKESHTTALPLTGFTPSANAVDPPPFIYFFSARYVERDRFEFLTPREFRQLLDVLHLIPPTNPPPNIRSSTRASRRSAPFSSSATCGIFTRWSLIAQQVFFGRHPVNPVELRQMYRPRIIAQRLLARQVEVHLEIRHHEFTQTPVHGLPESQPE